MRCIACDKPMNPREYSWVEERKCFEDMCPSCRKLAGPPSQEDLLGPTYTELVEGLKKDGDL